MRHDTGRRTPARKSQPNCRLLFSAAQAKASNKYAVIAFYLEQHVRLNVGKFEFLAGFKTYLLPCLIRRVPPCWGLIYMLCMGLRSI